MIAPCRSMKRLVHYVPVFPKPPVHNMTDFVVFCFVSIVTITLLLAALGILVSIIASPDKDRSSVIGALSDIITTLIGALVGFIAGKGQGRQEVLEEHEAKREAEKKVEK